MGMHRNRSGKIREKKSSQVKMVITKKKGECRVFAKNQRSGAQFENGGGGTELAQERSKEVRGY